MSSIPDAQVYNTDIHHTQVLQRLQQLRIWQRQQQEKLLPCPEPPCKGSGGSLHDSGMLTGQSSGTDVANDERDTESDNKPPSKALPHDEIPVNPGIGGQGSAKTFEELLERKLHQYNNRQSSTEVYPQPPTQSCTSEDSFVVRGIERQQMEEAELKEFELLERAAADHDVSFSSQSSLLSRLIINSSPKIRTESHPQPQSVMPKTESQASNHSTTTTRSHSASPDSHSSDPWTQSQSRLTPVLPYIDEEEPIIGELDSTLRQSDAQFNDSQSWDSFSEDNTPLKVVDDHTSSNNSPQVNEVISQGIPPVRKVRVLPETTEQKVAQYNSDLPPPSALVAKLFPTLRKERETSKTKYIKSLQLPVKNPPSHGLVKDKSPAPSEDSTSTLDKQVKEKLKELEEEIQRFKKENMTLDKLRKEREDALLELKHELLEFNKQKEDQLRAFEEYKAEEMRKLKKERKVFESYQREANAAKDQKMKEELSSLRQEIEDLQDEMRSKESRWTSTVSRYRVRIESLEAQNNELQNDLRMMEEQRLIWWQQQLEAKRSPMVVVKKTPPRQSSSCSPSQLEDINNSRQQTRKHRRQSDPLQHIKKAQYNKENKNPATIAIKEKSKKPKKPNVTRGVKATLKQSNTNVKVTKATPLESIDDDKVGVASDHFDDECEIIEVRAIEREPPDEEEQAEAIVNAVLLDTDGDSNTAGDVSVKRSVRFQEDLPSSNEDSNPVTSRDNEDQEDIQKVHVEEDGSKSIVFPNGTRKIVSMDGQTSTVYYYNGDIKRTLPDHTVVYVYSKCQTVHKTLPDGKEIIEFTNGQIETRNINGDKEITFPDGTIRNVYRNGEEKVIFGNGTVQYTHNNGEKTIDFTDGQKEIHTKDYKRRVYPDGTIKTVYLEDGRQETQYSNGTVRIKDKHGNILSAD